MPTPHEEIAEALLTVLQPLNGELRLLARLSDPLITNPSEKETHLFIPDLHLLTPDRRAEYDYGFNYSETDPGFHKSELLAALLASLYELKAAWDRQGDRELITVQLGDFFDLWRQFPGDVDQSQIQNSHGQVLDLLYRAPFVGADECLEAVMLLGNHDTRKGQFLDGIQFTRNYLNEAADGRPFLFANHGDAFDLIEHLPDALKEFTVNYFSGVHPVSTYDVGALSEAAANYNNARDFTSAITQPEHNLAGNAAVAIREPGAALPERFCEEIASPDEAADHHFGKYYEAIDDAAERDLMGQHVRVVVMGHTHMAKMVLYRPDQGRPMLLMDVGAWIERCIYPFADNGPASNVPSESSAQLGVINGNDARIYQIHLPQPAQPS
jgi:UDP-2,3-diacylglucosamine pyrophosphatase LpxH